MLKIDSNLIFVIINIIVLYLILKKFLFGPVTAVMEKRRQLIEDGLANARKTQADAAALKTQYEAAVGAAKEESRQILSDSRKKAKEESSRILEEADRQAKDALMKNQLDLEAQKQKMLDDMQSQVAELAMEAAGKMLMRETKEADNLNLYDRFLKQEGEKHDPDSL